MAGVELAKAESTLSEARDRGNPGQITRANNERDAAADIADMTRVMGDHRETWLTECRSAIRNVLPEERLTAVLLVRPAYWPTELSERHPGIGRSRADFP